MNYQKMVKQMQQLQRDMQKAQDELAQEKVEASVGGGMVTVVASGKLEILEVKIEPDAVDKNEVEMLQDMVLAGVNEALRKAQELTEQKLGGLAGGLSGLNIPGLT